ncbi:MAG: hypothetical protein HY248_02985, partial [Fimbriimonas ginsengisoli]|nr:hypothetical protein [Fimbriimonas ginsengisoli]
MTVPLSSGSVQVSTPPVVQVAEGSTSALFDVTSSLIDHDESAQITAALGTSSVHTVLALVGLRPVALDCAPKTVQSGSPFQCQVTLNSSQATGSAAFTLATGNTHVTVPVSVPSQPSQSTFGFQALTAFVPANQGATVSASFGGVTVQDTVTLSPGAPILTVPGSQVVNPGKLLTFAVSATDPAGLAVSLSVSGLPPDAGFNPNTGDFTWIPQLSQAGLYTVRFTAVNLALAAATRDVLIEVTSSTPVIFSLVNAASYVDSGCSPGTVATLMGTGFVKTGAKAAKTSPPPTELNGLRVRVNGEYLPVFYAAEGQVNFQCPQLAPGDA